MATRSPTPFHNYHGAYATGSLPSGANVEVGDTAFDTSLVVPVVCTSIGPVVWTPVGGITELTGDVVGGPASGSVAVTVAGIEGVPVDATLPTPGQVLAYNGVWWTPTTPSGGGTIAGTIAANEVAFGTAADTIGGSADLTWTPSPTSVLGVSGTVDVTGTGVNNIAINVTGGSKTTMYDSLGDLVLQIHPEVAEFLLQTGPTFGTPAVQNAQSPGYNVVQQHADVARTVLEASCAMEPAAITFTADTGIFTSQIRAFDTLSNPAPLNLEIGELQVNTNPGAAGEVLTSQGAGLPPVWAAGGGGSPAAPFNALQFNNSGAFGGDARLTYDSALNIVTLDAGIGANGIIVQDTGAVATSDVQAGQIVCMSGGGIAGATLSGLYGYLRLESDVGGAGDIPTIQAFDESDNPTTLELTVGGLTVNNNAGSAGEVLTSNGPGFAPTWQPAGGGGGGALQSISLNGTATGGAVAYIGSVYLPAGVTLTAAATAYIGGALVGDTTDLTLTPIAGGPAAATWTQSGTLGLATIIGPPVAVPAGWYDITLQATAASPPGSGTAFARGLYLG